MDLDPEAVRNRAETSRLEPEVINSRYWGTESDDPNWIAEDPETGCRGIGPSEDVALTNLVYAVNAYHEDTASDVGYVSAGHDKTYEMHWQRDRPSLVGRLKRFFPF